MFKDLFFVIRSIMLNINTRKIKVAFSARIRNRNTFEKYNKIGKHTYIKGKIGAFTYVGENCEIIGDVGRFCSISNNVRCVPASHPIDLVSTSPSFYSSQKSNNISFSKKDYFTDLEKPVLIGNDVWIGENVLIKGGVSIGDGAIVGMGSVLVKDVEPYSVVGGCPAKEIKKRFNVEVIKKMLEIKWWEKDFDYIERKANLFLDVNSFVKDFENE